ncbi:DNA-directed DNA polymerase [Teratosphaeriaceae sp. CCFEE 6253]|nr:DNA-directed DNA polymerase [Teratosphaeriaceae sp. CCFEE 6253]
MSAELGKRNISARVQNILDPSLQIFQRDAIMPAGVKRAAEDTRPPDDFHPSRRRRLEDGEASSRLAQIYNDLADEIPSVRLHGAGTLCKYLLSDSPDQVRRINIALDRLIKGLCSGRKAARLGFSVALAEALRLAFELDHADDFDLAQVTEKCIGLTRPDGKASRQEQREHLLGRRFAFQAILRSNVSGRKDVPEAHWEAFVKAIVDLANYKDWLRTECGAMLYEYLKSSEGARMTPSRIEGLIDALRQGNVLKTAEGVALWLAVSDCCPVSLPKGVWAKKNPMSADERPRLKKVMLGSVIDEEDVAADGKRSMPGSRQSQPNFVWKAVLGWLYERNVSHEFESFWSDVVERGLFHSSASTERKAMGLQVVALAVGSALPACLNTVLSESTVRMLIVQRSEDGRYLFDTAKQVFDSIIARAKLDPEVLPRLMHALLAEGAFDQQTKTKTLETMLQHASEDSLDAIVATFRMAILRPRVESESQVDTRRRTYADILINFVRLHKCNLLTEQLIAPWVKQVLQLLVDLGYRDIATEPSPRLSDATQAIFRSRLTSCISLAMDRPKPLIGGMLSCILSTLEASWKSLSKPLGKEAKEILKTAEQARRDLATKSGSLPVPESTAASAFDMLFGLSMLQVYNREPDSVEALEDLQASYHAWDGGLESSTGVVELLLSFVSQQSAALRKLAEHAFTILAGDMTAESVQSLLDILEQKETLSGQQELFDQPDDDADSATDDPDDEAQDNDAIEPGIEQDDGDAMNVEDASDVELVIGEDADSSPNDESGSASDAEEGGGADDDDDEEAVFDRKLADALGTASMDETDSDDDGSDMDDEQMMALEPHLATIFKERSKVAAKKQDHKDAKENIVSFKNRVLDLLAICVKSQHANVIALDVILPLTTLVRTTSRKPTAEKAFAVLKQYFEACNKNKSLPQPGDSEALLELLARIHDETKLGGSKLHAHACSRSSLFLGKVLVAMDARNYEHIAQMYASLQSGWYADPKSKVHGTIFTEWTSWSLATRKQK